MLPNLSAMHTPLLYGSLATDAASGRVYSTHADKGDNASQVGPQGQGALGRSRGMRGTAA